MRWLNMLSRSLLVILVVGTVFIGSPVKSAHAASCWFYSVSNSFGPNPVAQGEIFYANLNLGVVLDDMSFGTGVVRFRAVNSGGQIVADKYIGVFNSSPQTQHIPVWTPYVQPGVYITTLTVETVCGTRTFSQKITLLY